MSVINTNLKSLVAQNSLRTNERNLSNSMQQLSTGMRINSAGDDAAGLSISSKMTAQIRGLDQAVRNGNDGISLLQTSEGAMVEMTNMLQRMRELAVQSANDTNTSSDKGNLNNEYQQLKSEIVRIANTTQWNGVKVLNGNDLFGTIAGDDQRVTFQMGSASGDTFSVDFKNFSFSTNATSPVESTAQINMGSVTAGGADLQTFKISIAKPDGTVVPMVINFAQTVSADPTDADATALATQIQTAIRTYSGFESVSVSSNGQILNFSNANGGVFSAASFTKDDATAVTLTGALGITYSASGVGTNTAPSNSVFSNSGGVDADISASAITSSTLATAAILKLDNALANVNGERSKFGATINRLTYAVDNLANLSQNTSASRSRILDTDYAKSSTELARTQIIQQAATAMLAQANQSSQSVLALLK